MKKSELKGNLIDKLQAFHDGARTAQSPRGETGLFLDAAQEIGRLSTVVLGSDLSLREKLEMSLLTESLKNAHKKETSDESLKELALAAAVKITFMQDKCREKGINPGVSEADARDAAILSRMNREKKPTNSVRP